MRSSSSLLGRILFWIALQARIFEVAKTECNPCATYQVRTMD